MITPPTKGVPPVDNKSGEDRAKPGVPGLIGRVVGGAGVAGAAYYQPMVLGGVGVLVLLLVVGVVFPGVWSRNAERRDAAEAMLRLLLTALVGDRVAGVVTAPVDEGTSVPGDIGPELPNVPPDPCAAVVPRQRCTGDD
ncbi:MAG: hypothetical protein M3R66_14015 [Actinomycetota bacterium]|jgi:hypothetical protein|nr:hypothetical protein [Actinomycetota bacterium]